ncbi:MAG: hypothetical protein A2W93_08265 [Bacteroidetes bacterium GWF2_43_63]|nr:MAG: hypothetical protein A2W94_04920 [Bacteroidetes bacterium GWE2_42_42]OFY55603.1 MAG: hypothetical protein A2W93_08265 [Bacteroidetes bacterium GWF2_43_63]HBG71622.1 hypothetical protein [Bacteroidales bacterium]HCB62155.1 hypothetical protein [Bacteroidales bacterium]HCY22383.1 hypothetical protein [Bacteroidales bacterium]
MNLLFLWENNDSMIKALIFAVLLGLAIVAQSQIIPADSIYCDSIVKADTNYVKYYHDKKYYSNGNLKGEALILRKRMNAQFDIDITVGRITEFYRNGDLYQVYYNDYNGRASGSDTMFYYSQVLKKVKIYDSVSVYHYKRNSMSDSFTPDNYYLKKFYQNGVPRKEGRLFNLEEQLAHERRGKWIFYSKNGAVRKVKYY